MLFTRAELLDVLDDRGEDRVGLERSVAPEAFDEAAFAELFFVLVEGFSDAIGKESEDVAGSELAFDGLRAPLLEEPEDGGRGVEILDVPVVAQEDA